MHPHDLLLLFILVELLSSGILFIYFCAKSLKFIQLHDEYIRTKDPKNADNFTIGMFIGNPGYYGFKSMIRLLQPFAHPDAELNRLRMQARTFFILAILIPLSAVAMTAILITL